MPERSCSYSTIGLWKLNNDGTRSITANGDSLPTYDNEDIKVLAKVFTGLWLKNTRFGKTEWSMFDQPMVMHEGQHDQSGKYALAGLLDLPAGQAGMKDMAQTISVLANHPNTAPFISTRLIRYLVTSNPSAAYIRRVVDQWHSSSGNLGVVVTAILLDPEARHPEQVGKHTGRLRGPVARVVHLIKAFGCGAGLGMGPEDYPGLQWWQPSPVDALQQEPFRAPNVFGFYDIEYQVPGVDDKNNTFSPEFQMANDVTAVSVINYAWHGINRGFHLKKTGGKMDRFLCEFTKEIDMLNRNEQSFLEHVNLMLTGGTLSKRTLALIKNQMNSVVKPIDKVRVAIIGAFSATEGAITK